MCWATLAQMTQTSSPARCVCLIKTPHVYGENASDLQLKAQKASLNLECVGDAWCVHEVEVFFVFYLGPFARNWADFQRWIGRVLSSRCGNPGEKKQPWQRRRGPRLCAALSRQHKIQRHRGKEKKIEQTKEFGGGKYLKAKINKPLNNYWIICWAGRKRHSGSIMEDSCYTVLALADKEEKRSNA